MFPRRSRNARVRARAAREALPPVGGSGVAFGPPREARGFGGAAGPPILYLAKLKIYFFVKLILSRVVL